MTEPRTVQTATYVTPKKSDEEIIAKALKPEQPLTPFQKHKQELIEQFISKLMLENNMTRVCKEMGISRTTGYEYWHIWEETEEAQYVNAEWWSLYHEVKKKNPSAALKMLTSLKLRFHPEKFDFKGEITSTTRVIHLHMWRPGDEPADKPSPV